MLHVLPILTSLAILNILFFPRIIRNCVTEIFLQRIPIVLSLHAALWIRFCAAMHRYMRPQVCSFHDLTAGSRDYHHRGFILAVVHFDHVSDHAPIRYESTIARINHAIGHRASFAFAKQRLGEGGGGETGE